MTGLPPRRPPPPLPGAQTRADIARPAPDPSNAGGPAPTPPPPGAHQQNGGAPGYPQPAPQGYPQPAPQGYAQPAPQGYAQPAPQGHAQQAPQVPSRQPVQGSPARTVLGMASPAPAPHAPAPIAASPAASPATSNIANPGGGATGSSRASSPDRALPQTFFLGRYRVVDEIGVGGMASVHLARVDGPGGFQKWVAIKRIHPHLVEDDQFVDMFLDEARIAAGINHANVAQVFDLGKDDNTYWIAMEYLHGEPLREAMRRVDELGSTIPFHIAAKICADSAEGLHGAHELRGRTGQLLNLVHRDVTPHNLFVTYDGYTKVVDFGIAKVVDRLASTRAGTLQGTLAYMSPEQVRGQEVDRRTDIFALGVVLWELTTNRRLFRMDTDLETLEKVQSCIVPLPSSVVSGYPPALEAVVMRALAQRREDRFQTAREFSRALNESLMKQGLLVGPEDVGDYLKKLFADRVKKREQYLEWAAEVTSSVDLDALRAQQGGDVAPAAAPQAQAARPASPRGDSGARSGPSGGGGPSGGAAKNLGASVITSAAKRPRVASEPPPGLAQTSLMDEDEDIPTQVATQAHEAQLAAFTAQEKAPGASRSPWQAPSGEHAFESTIAMTDSQLATAAPMPAARREQAPLAPPQHASQHQGFAGGPSHAPGQGGFSAAPPGTTPPPPPARPGAPAGAQGVIETRMNLPRPVGIAQWLSEQGDVQLPSPRSTGVLMAVALLATLCVIGIGAIVTYKLRVPPAIPGSTAPVAAVTGAPAGSSPALATSTPTGETPRGTGDAGKAEPRARGTDAAGSGSSASNGTLTVTCKPACDQVIAAGRSLGPSPVIGQPIPAGQHHVTLKRGSNSKVVFVTVEAGRLTTHPDTAP